MVANSPVHGLIHGHTRLHTGRSQQAWCRVYQHEQDVGMADRGGGGFPAGMINSWDAF